MNHWYDRLFWIFAAGVGGFILWIWGSMAFESMRARRPAGRSRGTARDDDGWSLAGASGSAPGSMTFSSSDMSPGDSSSDSSSSGGGYESGGGDFGGGGSSGGWS